MSADTDLAIALALSERRTSSLDGTHYDENLARCIQDEEIANFQSTLGEHF